MPTVTCPAPPQRTDVTGTPYYLEAEVFKAAVASVDWVPTRTRGRASRVLARFVVDSAGRAVPATFDFREASDSTFVADVRESLRKSRFLPAELRGGCRVRQLVDMPFTITLAP